MLAYQGYGSGRDLDELQTLTRIATGGLRPDVTFYLDLPAEEGLERKRKAAQRPGSPNPLAPQTQPPPEPPEWNRLDARDLAYHERVRDGFLELTRRDPERWQILDAHLPMDELAERIWRIVEPRLAGIKRLGDQTS
jgi:dTMP kinase